MNSPSLNCSEILHFGQTFLETADFIGAKLCRDAIWSGNRCNWTGAKLIRLNNGRQSVAIRSCGPDLFDGTTGIAIFLARLFALTHERVFRLTAEAAVHQALSRLDDIPGEKRIGFYKGLTGVAYALSELAELLDIPKFRPMTLLLLEEADRDQYATQEVDVLSGRAGAIVALLKIHSRLSHELPLELAIKQGERLLDRKVNASGFANGDAGIAWALSELYHATKLDRFREATARYGNNSSIQSSASNSENGNQTRWLDGASGKGMALLRRYELSGDAALLDRAKPAIEKVAKRLSAVSFDLGGTDYSPAYGVTGEAELLLDAAAVLDKANYKQLAERVGLVGIECFRKDDLPWPCGEIADGEHPGLMNGLAGIAHFYLRLFDRKRISSLLLLTCGPIT